MSFTLLPPIERICLPSMYSSLKPISAAPLESQLHNKPYPRGPSARRTCTWGKARSRRDDRTFEEIFSDTLAAGADGVDFGVGGAVDGGKYGVVGRGNHVVTLGNRAAEGAITGRQSLAGLLDCQTHEFRGIDGHE